MCPTHLTSRSPLTRNKLKVLTPKSNTKGTPQLQRHTYLVLKVHHLLASLLGSSFDILAEAYQVALVGFQSVSEAVEGPGHLKEATFRAQTTRGRNNASKPRIWGPHPCTDHYIGISRPEERETGTLGRDEFFAVRRLS